MTEVAVAFPASGEWTLEDLFGLPQTGHRYEIIEGSLLVTPPAGFRHGAVAAQLATLLQDAASAEWSVFATGQGIHLGRSVLVPDVVVVATAAAEREPDAAEPPDVALVVEVLSPSNRMTDLVTKRAAYAAGGIPHYWIVDPVVPSLTVLRLDGEAYVDVAVARDDEPYVAAEPFGIIVVPAELRRPPVGRG